MIADKIYKWLTGGFTDRHVVVLLSIAVSVITYYISTTSFFDLSNSNKLIQFIEACIMIPTGLVGLVISTLQIDGGNLEGWGFFLVFIAPVTNLVFWFFIFSFASKGMSKLFKSKSPLVKHVLSLGVVVFLISPYLFYSFSNHEMNACLGGKFNTPYPGTPGEIQQGAIQCFERIAKKDLGSDLGNPAVTSKYCSKLSDSKIALIGRNNIPVTYRDFCNNNFGDKNITLNSVFSRGTLANRQIIMSGSGFSKNELEVWLYSGNDIHGIIWKGVSPNDNELSFKIGEQSCAVIGVACANLIGIAPGKYKIKIISQPTFSDLRSTPMVDLEII